MHPVFILLLAVILVLVGILWLRLNAFVALILAAMFVALLTPQARLEDYATSQVESEKWTEKQATSFLEKETFGVRVAKGFGNTCAGVGILIAMASIIGRCLLDSGAADRIVSSMMKVFGEARAGITFVLSGFLLGIPVFFDTVFYLMIPLGKAAARRVGGNYVFFILTIVAGATMAHSLVPPTPGPLIVVEQFGVDLGLMIIAGTLVGLVASTAGYILAMFLNRWIHVEVPADEEDESNPPRDATVTQSDQSSGGDSATVPSLGMSLLPILLPVLLIGLGTAAGLMMKSASSTDGESTKANETLEMVALILKALGDKNVALVLAAAIAVLLLVRSRRLSRKQLSEKLQSAIMGAGMIILITAAGGAFGMSIRQCGIASEIAKLTRDMQPLMLLPLAFCITTMIRTAQGSATVAMVTAAGVLQGFADSELLQFNVVYLALAVGCGSKPIAWMADSGFWVICKMSGMTESQGLRTVTPMSIVMGLAGLIATIIGAIVIPWPDQMFG